MVQNIRYIFQQLIIKCDGAVAGERLELRPPVESSNLDDKVLPLHRLETPEREFKNIHLR
jgi:hypothetical protein